MHSFFIGINIICSSLSIHGFIYPSGTISISIGTGSYGNTGTENSPFVYNIINNAQDEQFSIQWSFSDQSALNPYTYYYTFKVNSGSEVNVGMANFLTKKASDFRNHPYKGEYTIRISLYIMDFNQAVKIAQKEVKIWVEVIDTTVIIRDANGNTINHYDYLKFGRSNPFSIQFRITVEQSTRVKIYCDNELKQTLYVGTNYQPFTTFTITLTKDDFKTGGIDNHSQGFAYATHRITIVNEYDKSGNTYSKTDSKTFYASWNSADVTIYILGFKTGTAWVLNRQYHFYINDVKLGTTELLARNRLYDSSTIHFQNPEPINANQEQTVAIITIRFGKNEAYYASFSIGSNYGHMNRDFNGDNYYVSGYSLYSDGSPYRSLRTSGPFYNNVMDIGLWSADFPSGSYVIFNFKITNLRI